MRTCFLFVTLAFCGVTLFAQSDAETVWKETKDLPSTPAVVSHRTFNIRPATTPVIAAIQNVLTVVGDNVDNSGVPCFQCVTNALGNNIGLVTPDTNVHADNTTSYAFDNYLVDNSYTGSCDFTFLVKDAAGKYILKLGPFSFAESPSSSSLTSTASVLPLDPSAVGTGAALTLVVCGTAKGVSTMPLFINYP